jgi:hypothetical protein
MAYNRNMKLKSPWECLYFTLLSVSYVYLCFPFFHFLPSECPYSEANTVRHIFQAIEEDDGLEDDEHLLIRPFSKCITHADSSNVEKADVFCRWIWAKQLFITSRPPPISS